MTNRDFLTAVINNSVSVEEIDFAKAELAKLDKRNAKRRETPTKEQKANELVKESIVNSLSGRYITASEIAASVDISTQKASALLRQLVSAELVAVKDEKVKGKGTVKVYALVGGSDGESEIEG